MPRPTRLVLATTTALLGACDPMPKSDDGPDDGPVAAIAPEGHVDVALHPGVAAIFAPADWRHGAPVRAGDLDGDGLDDLVLTRWHDTEYEQEVRIVYGGPRLASRNAFAAAGPAIRTIHVPGGGCAVLGDIDGDATSELLLVDAGDRILRGGTRIEGDVDTSIAEVALRFSWPRQWFAAGDVDGDGFGDVGVLTDTTALGVWRGGAEASAPTTMMDPQIVPVRGAVSEERWFGIHVSPGDLDGDGRDDLVYMLDDERTGTWGIEIVYGRSDLADRPIGAPDARLVPEAYAVLAGLGDFDGDGRDELLSRTHEGAARWVRTTDRLIGEHALEAVSNVLSQDPLHDLAWAGDLDADGTDDIAAMRRLAGGGIAVLLWYGRRGATELPSEPHATLVFPVERTGSTSTLGETELAVSAAGDLDGDGYQDMAVTTEAALWLFYGGPRDPDVGG
jgi:hypothetical protein